MARPLRALIRNGWYHIYSRGIERNNIFRDDRDREHFLELLGETHARYRVLIHAWALLGNHYHIIMQTPDANISHAMQWLHGSYSMWFNVKHDRSGPLFQGRFKSTPVENGSWAYRLSLYVHLNPLRIAELGLDERGRVLEGKGYQRPAQKQVSARLKLLRAYRWSSYRAYAGYEEAPPWLERRELLGRAHRDADQAERQIRMDAYRLLTAGVDASDVEQLRDAVAIGGTAFVRRVKDLAAGQSLRGIQEKRALCRRVPVEDARKAVESLKGEPFAAFSRRRGDWGRPFFLWIARRYCGLSLLEIGQEAGGMNEAAVGMALRRFEERMKDSCELRAQYAKAVKMLDVKP